MARVLEKLAAHGTIAPQGVTVSGAFSIRDQGAAVTREKAWLMGLLAGDGYIRLRFNDTAGQVSVLCGPDRQLAEAAVKAFAAVYGVGTEVRVEQPKPDATARRDKKQTFYYVEIQIAARAGLKDAHAVQNLLTRAQKRGEVRLARGTKQRDHLPKILAMRAEGKTFREAGLMLGYPPKRAALATINVIQWAKRRGLLPDESRSVASVATPSEAGSLTPGLNSREV